MNQPITQATATIQGSWDAELRAPQREAFTSMTDAPVVTPPETKPDRAPVIPAPEYDPGTQPCGKPGDSTCPMPSFPDNN